jgi:hypothetical protein
MAVEVSTEVGGTPEAIAAETSVASEASERSTLESRVADGLKGLMDDAPANDDTTAEKTVVSGDEVETPGTEAADDVVEGDTEEEAKEGEQTPTKPAAAAPTTKTSTLPAAYVRSLKALEWTDAEIETAAANPAFITTAAKLHQTRNQELAQWAQLGRAKQQETAAQQAANPSRGFQPLAQTDPAALKAKYGNDELIDLLVGPLNATVAQINAMLPVIQQTQQSSVQAHLDTLNRQVESFFGGDELKPYGPDRDDPEGFAQGSVRGHVGFAELRVLPDLPESVGRSTAAPASSGT